MTKNKYKIAIYDFTDCEGCEVQIISLREKLLDLEDRFDIVDWRLGQKKKEEGPFFATFIEGTPMTKEEIDTLKYLRENSIYLFSLGACASIAGIPGIIQKEEREKLYKEIYSQDYKPKGTDALPLSAYVKVDFSIHGCPVDLDELVRIFEELLSGKKPSYRDSSVCLDCKLALNSCRLISSKPCLGPITQSGCKAVCISGSSPCYGCFGLREDANIPALIKILKNFSTKEEIEKFFGMFYGNFSELKDKLKNNL